METTIATQTPTMEIFKDYVYLGRTATDYINLIESIKEDSPEKTQERIDFATGHTWENNVQEIYKAISN
jgi:hypothetical protein